MSSYTEGQVHQLVDAFEVAGFTKVHLTRLGQAPDILKNLLKVLNGTATFNLPLAIGWELYLLPTQEKGETIRGFYLESHLKETGLIDRCFSIEDDLVRGWVANPATYPEELKGKMVFLWKSAQGRDGDRYVPYLIWGGNKVVVDWSWLEYRWSVSSPALLASSS